MNARELYELVKPVWDAWPETQPKSLTRHGDDTEIWFEVGYDTTIEVDIVEALCTAAMVKWLADDGDTNRAVTIAMTGDGWVVVLRARDESRADISVNHDSLIEALCSACLALKGTK
jgi:hypothetical protein